MPLRFAVIGCGAIARMHLEAISSIPEAELSIVVCRSEERARKIEEEFGCRIVKDPFEAAQDPEIDAIDIITPSGARRDIAVAAAKAGKHIIMEKPLEITTKRVDDMLKACEEAKVKCTGIFQFRYKPAWIFAKKAVTAGYLGKLVLGDAYNKWWRTQEYYDGSSWRGTWELDGGGALMNQGIHAIDLLQWIMGDVLEVYANTSTLAHENIEVEDTAVAVLKFKGGALGVIEGTTSVYPGYPMKLEIHGTKGSLIVSGDHIVDFQSTIAPPEAFEEAKGLYAPVVSMSTASDPAQVDCTWHRMQIEDFVRSVLHGTEPSVPGAEGRKSVEIINAIYESSRTKMPIKLPL